MGHYIVTFRESALVTELVYAESKREAIDLVKHGEGDRVGFEIDENRMPTAFTAELDASDNQTTEGS